MNAKHFAWLVLSLCLSSVVYAQANCPVESSEGPSLFPDLPSMMKGVSGRWVGCDEKGRRVSLEFLDGVGVIGTKATHKNFYGDHTGCNWKGQVNNPLHEKGKLALIVSNISCKSGVVGEERGGIVGDVELRGGRDRVSTVTISFSNGSGGISKYATYVRMPSSRPLP